MTITSPTHLTLKMGCHESCDDALVRAKALAAANNKPVLVFHKVALPYVDHIPIYDVAVDGTHRALGPSFLHEEAPEGTP